MGKFNYVCEFGEVHRTDNCRCMSTHVSVRHIECDVVEEHAGKDIAEAKTGESLLKTLHERLEETVDSFFGAIIMPVVKKSLVDKLEQDVSEWLIEAAEHIRSEHGEDDYSAGRQR